MPSTEYGTLLEQARSDARVVGSSSPACVAEMPLSRVSGDPPTKQRDENSPNPPETSLVAFAHDTFEALTGTYP